ncbi:MAG TPA: phytanoyl-CoA dioxygenase family protein [Abditibacteriaceae bacterium]|nr:phytanoyl-CoA dioxygenase family protein [Abditibacteriaceae bacterium]
MDSAEKQDYADNGYLIVRGALQGAAMEELRRELEELRRNVESGRWRGNHLFEAGNTARVIFNPYDFCPSLRQLVARDDMVGRARDMLGSALHLHHTKMMCKPAALGTAQPWHQDYFYWPGKKANQVAVFVCIDPSREANGCLRVVPGSHQKGLLPHHEEYHPGTGERHWVCETALEMLEQRVAFIGEPGDAIFFSSLVIHGSEDNSSGTPRRAVIFEYDELYNLDPTPGWGAPIPAVQWV